MFVQAEDVELGLLPTAVRHRGPALLVHVEHQPLGLGQRVAEELLQHEGHVLHEVDRVVPDDDHPGSVRIGDVVRRDLLDLGRCRHGRRPRHGPIVPHPGASVMCRAGSGCTVRPRWNHTAAIHTIIAPATCTATSPGGTPMAYWVYPIAPCPRIAAIRTVPRRRTDGLGPPRSTCQRTAMASTRNAHAMRLWMRATDSTSKGIRRTFSPPP